MTRITLEYRYSDGDVVAYSEKAMHSWEIDKIEELLAYWRKDLIPNEDYHPPIEYNIKIKVD